MQIETDIDQVLVRKVQSGDRSAFDRIVERYQHRLLRVVAQLVRNPAEAEDIVQDSFIKALRALPDFRQDSALYTWLYRIAINSAKNHLKLRAREAALIAAPVDKDGIDYEVESSCGTPETLLTDKQIVSHLNRTLDIMPLVLSTAIVLREIEGMSYEQIAEVMCCPVGTVRSRISRARELLSKTLTPLFDHQTRQQS